LARGLPTRLPTTKEEWVAVEEPRERTAEELDNWADAIAADGWAQDRAAIDGLRQHGVPFVIGGGMAFSYYARRWRDTKDVDFFIRKQDRGKAVETLTEIGFVDYHDEKPYDRSWIYRGYKDGNIIDMIWEMANHRAAVDEAWFERAEEVPMRDRRVKMVSPEDLVWLKLYVFQRERCDWPDLLNVLYSRVTRIDWDLLIGNVAEDRMLLASLMALFAWVCPERAATVPEPVWRRLGLDKPPITPACVDDPIRVNLLESRPWFGPRA
jgi:predicted nucleotidyltransferase